MTSHIYCDYLLKMGRMDKEQAIFEQLKLQATSRSGVPQHERRTLWSEKIFENEIPFEMMKNNFHLKSSSRSNDI